MSTNSFIHNNTCPTFQRFSILVSMLATPTVSSWTAAMTPTAQMVNAFWLVGLDTIPNGTIPNGHNGESTRSRLDTFPNGHLPEWTPPGMDAIPNEQDFEWIPSQMDAIPNGHNPKCTQSRMARSGIDTIPNGHDSEWTQSQLST